ncbi:unnamed protein product, partial [Closterium sp. NIES-53]
MGSRGNTTGRTYAARWSSEEDKILLEHVLYNGTSQWALLQQSNMLGRHRDSKACCNRFLLLKRKFIQDANKADSISSAPGSGTVPSIMSGCGLGGSVDSDDPFDSEESMMDFPVPPMPVHEIMRCLHSSAAEMAAEDAVADASNNGASDGAGNLIASSNPTSAIPASDAHVFDAPAHGRADAAAKDQQDGVASQGTPFLRSSASSTSASLRSPTPAMEAGRETGSTPMQPATCASPRGSTPAGAGLASASSSTDSSPLAAGATARAGQVAESSSDRADSRKCLDEHNKAI